MLCQRKPKQILENFCFVYLLLRTNCGFWNEIGKKRWLRKNYITSIFISLCKCETLPLFSYLHYFFFIMFITQCLLLFKLNCFQTYIFRLVKQECLVAVHQPSPKASVWHVRLSTITENCLILYTTMRTFKTKPKRSYRIGSCMTLVPWM